MVYDNLPRNRASLDLLFGTWRRLSVFVDVTKLRGNKPVESHNTIL